MVRGSNADAGADSQTLQNSISHPAQAGFPHLMRSYGWVLGMCGIAALGIWLLKANLSAEFGPVDDYVILSFLGSDGEMTMTEIPAQLLDTEVGSWGKVARYRPSYWVLWLTESWLWGPNAKSWYTARMAFYTVSFCILYWLLRMWLGSFFALAFVVILMGADYWGGVFARLGPSEIYGFLGCSLYALGFVQKVVSLKNTPRVSTTRAQCILMLLGAFIALGCKENFLPIAGLSCGLLAYAWITDRCRPKQGSRSGADRALFGCTVAIVAYALFIAGAISAYLATAKADLYLNSVSVDSRLVVAKHGVAQVCRAFALPLAGFVCVMAVAWPRLRRQSHSEKELWELSAWTLGGMLLLIAFYLFQFIFYNGNWPQFNRYDFPGMMAIPFAWLLVFTYAIRSLALFVGEKRGLTLAKVICLVAFLLLLQPGKARIFKPAGLRPPTSWPAFVSVVSSSEPLHGLAKLRQSCSENRDRTRSFAQTIRGLAALLRQDPSRPLIMYSGNPIDFEPIYGTKRFLEFNGATNPTYLRLAFTPETVKPGLEADLARQLQTASQGTDSPGGLHWGFQPISALDTNMNPVVVGFCHGTALSNHRWEIVY